MTSSVRRGRAITFESNGTTVVTDTQNGNTVIFSKEKMEKSYNDGNNVESIIVTHYALSVLMNRIFYTFKSSFQWGRKGNSEAMRIDMKDERLPSILPSYGYLTIARILLDTGILSAEMFLKIKSFNTQRNSVTHRLLEDMPSKRQLDSYFKLGLEIWDNLAKIDRTVNTLFQG